MGQPDARAMWDGVAEAYFRQSERAFQAGSAVSAWLCDAAGAAPGRTILDIAAGPGQTSLVAAARGARVLCTDNAPAMLDVARRVLAAAGHDDVDYRVVDAMAIDLPDASVDGAVSRYGVMLMPDPARVVSEVRRVLRPGGTFAWAVWREEELNGWATLIRRAMAAAGFEVPPLPPGPGMFVLADPRVNEQMARAAGFTDVETTTFELPMRFDSVEQYWEMRVSASPATREMFAPLSAEDLARVRAAAEELAAPFVDGDELVFPTHTLAVRAS